MSKSKIIGRVIAVGAIGALLAASLSGCGAKLSNSAWEINPDSKIKIENNLWYSSMRSGYTVYENDAAKLVCMDSSDKTDSGKPSRVYSMRLYNKQQGDKLVETKLVANSGKAGGESVSVSCSPENPTAWSGCFADFTLVYDLDSGNKDKDFSAEMEMSTATASAEGENKNGSNKFTITMPTVMDGASQQSYDPFNYNAISHVTVGASSVGQTVFSADKIAVSVKTIQINAGTQKAKAVFSFDNQTGDEIKISAKENMFSVGDCMVRAEMKDGSEVVIPSKQSKEVTVEIALPYNMTLPEFNALGSTAVFEVRSGLMAASLMRFVF